ncbi:cobalamin synthesis protein P47K, partial [Coccomyxa subellipsoidea C-169]
LPVMLISGFLGAGKTTLLRHLLSNTEGVRCAIIVNDMAELNIDAALLKNARLVQATQAQEELVELSNGCICCTLRGDLLREVTRLAKSRAFDYLLIESTGVSEPMQVAETFTLDVDDGSQAELKDMATLDTCVTVVDAAQLMANFESLQTLKQRDPDIADEDDRNVADLMLDQIEFADVILLNKARDFDAAELARLEALLHSLNTEAKVIATKEGAVAPKAIMGTGRFSLEKAETAPGWLKAMREGESATPETEEYGIGSFVYRARRPFHPGRLHSFFTSYFTLQQPQPDLDESDSEGGMHGMHLTVTTQGFMWLAGRDDMMGDWSQAGGTLRVGPAGPWFAAVPEEAWPDDERARAGIRKDFEGDAGDRRQELVFIGIDIKREMLTEELNRCLM